VVEREVEEVPMQRRVADGKRCQEHGCNVLGGRHAEVQVKAITGDERGDIGWGLFATKDLESGLYFKHLEVPHIAVITAAKVKAGAELLLDKYGKEYWEGRQFNR
jgi:hypothetical protein